MRNRQDTNIEFVPFLQPDINTLNLEGLAISYDRK